MSRLLAEVMSTISRNDVLLIPFDIYFTSFLMALFPVMERESESHSVVSNSLRPHGLYSPWNSPGQNTRVGSLSLLQWDLSDPGIKAGSPALQADSLPAELSRKLAAGLRVDSPPCVPFAPARPSCYCARPQPQFHGLSCEIGFSHIALPACQEVRKSVKTSGAKKLHRCLCQ